MSFTEIKTPDSALAGLITQALAKLESYQKTGNPNWLLVDTHEQRLILLTGATAVGAWPISTAAVGLDNRQDSGGTPPGVHHIAQKIGSGSPAGTVFCSREPTGEVWPSDQATDGDLILTRILTLAGCEPGLNQGEGVDSLARYIYLHGTNHEDQIGQPVSHGCVRLTNADICDVFDQIAQGDPVVII